MERQTQRIDGLMRARVLLAFAVRARDSHPSTAQWAAWAIGLNDIPRDAIGALARIRPPRPDCAAKLPILVHSRELVDPLVTGLRLITHVTAASAISAADEWRINSVLDFVCPVFVTAMPQFVADIDHIRSAIVRGTLMSQIKTALAPVGDRETALAAASALTACLRDIVMSDAITDDDRKQLLRRVTAACTKHPSARWSLSP